ncbi:MAG: FtsW/RodA/SpoVE family cell cycle protein, partial [Clostridia bacterium]|nr:FtsW/RodA/SpoVE family cell cycle protein [Clostridia bacterium]
VKLGMQVVFNIGVVTNTLPSTGINLPFITYGGTALLISLVEMGLILAFSRFSYTERGEEE